jgi:GT2 family glycosyltransferase
VNSQAIPARPLTASVIICAYSDARWDCLREAVQSLNSQSVQPAEVIVVIDHNASLLGRAQETFAEARVVENRFARGLSGARNTGVGLARGEVVAFLDDDARAAPNWLERLLSAYTDEGIIGVGGAIQPIWAEARPAWFPREFDWVVGCSYRGLPLAQAPVRNLIGANMSLRRGVFAGVGGFSSEIGRVEKLPAGCEETELCIRARQHWPAAVMLYNPAAEVSHHVPAERASWRYFTSRCFGEGRSKAVVARLVGATAGLESERAYVRRTLPAGIGRGLGDLLARGDGAGALRAAAIVAGALLTLAGYLTGQLRGIGHRAQPIEQSSF